MEASKAIPTTVIEPARGWHLPNFSELWSYRDLLYFLGRREIVIRYKQAVVGAFWAVLQPLMLAGMFAVFLGLLAKIESPDIPYPLLAVSGLVLWIPISRAIEMGTMSTVLYEGLITKIYLPRISIPIAATAAPALDMIVGVFVAVAIAAGYGYEPTIRIVVVPLIMVVALAIALGLGMWFSAVNVKYRDLTLAVPTLMMVGLFISPITYPFSSVLAQAPGWVEPFYSLNPIVGVLETFRWALLGTEFPSLLVTTVPLVAAGASLMFGAMYYERAQRDFADVI